MSLTSEELSQYLEKFSFHEQKRGKSDNSSHLSISKATIVEEMAIKSQLVKKYINEFWTSKQRQAASIHEISYRACFKPQLPRFFISLLSKVGDTIYDPFAGRGTTVIEAGLMNRKVISNDINPLSEILIRPRLEIPTFDQIQERLDQILFDSSLKAEIDLSMFYHPNTETELVSLKNYLSEKILHQEEDEIDRWIRMVATNRLTGHSPGFFSVYTLPPNQAVSAESQIKINQKRHQTPSYRDVKQIILRKSKSLLSNITDEIRTLLKKIADKALFLTSDARATTQIPDETVQLTITSPPFLNIVQYSKDNWLRCWFNSIDVDTVSPKITMAKNIKDWSIVMDGVFQQLARITKKQGWIAFEVGEINNGKINLEDYIVPIGLQNGFECFGVLINLQAFTKTSNIWGVNNNQRGTNTNRIILFKK